MSLASEGIYGFLLPITIILIIPINDWPADNIQAESIFDHILFVGLLPSARRTRNYAPKMSQPCCIGRPHLRAGRIRPGRNYARRQTRALGQPFGKRQRKIGAWASKPSARRLGDRA